MAHVLIVDDSSVSRDFVAGYLSRNGFEVATASDGREGLAQLRDDPSIRLVVSDVNMPNMDGITMAEKMRQELCNKQVRIVMLTTENNTKLRERGKAVGVNGWIVKPFRGEQVLGSFRMICGLN
ncbi:response regulator [Ideonella sp. DXS22W]|uniref:Response regulator n=1 Tax=Pseudaquabacterium inlustre TaxID=2984192 RepID=A0ABU9CKC5_9BURK